MLKRIKELKYADWWIIICYLVLVFIGWLSIFAAVYDPEHGRIIDTSQRYGMQMIWIIVAFVLAFGILSSDAKIYPAISHIVYIGGILLLIAVLVVGRESHGSRSWLGFSSFWIQPAEFMKIALSLMFANIMSKHDYKLNSFKKYAQLGAVLLLPIALILLENETGLTIVFSAFLIVFYREGMPGWILLVMIFLIALFLLAILWPIPIVLFTILEVCCVAFLIMKQNVKTGILLCILVPIIYFVTPHICNLFEYDLETILPQPYFILSIIGVMTLIGVIYALHKNDKIIKVILASMAVAIIFVFSVEYIFRNVLKDHQRLRIETLVGINDDIYGSGYNVHQSKIAIGSGGFFGKGFLKGTQTKFNFVPEQSTDFIFCTIGEEKGFIGSSVVITIFLILLWRLIMAAERQKDAFTRIYGYCVASCMFIHFFINVGMTIGITPVIGIPLPFVSYGGSSLMSFTILLFIFIKLDAAHK